MSIAKHIEVWDGCLSIISNLVDGQKYDTWFRPLKPVSFVDNTITIEAPSDFFREYLEEAYLDVIKFAITRVIGENARLEYLVKPVMGQEAMRIPAARARRPENKAVAVKTYPVDARPSAMMYPGLRRVNIDPRLNSVYCFENLVVGECNKMGVAAGMSIAEAPGNTPFNPFFIFGGPGLGKTHIAQAVGIAIKQKYPDLVVLYVTGSEFKNQYMDRVGVKNEITDFMAFYMRIDVLIVDDVQELVSKGTQQAFFNIFNYLHDNGKQLIFTSDRSPAELKNFEERMLTRLKWGLSVKLKRPSYKTRFEALKARSDREGVKIEEGILRYIAKRIKTNFRELEGALISMMAHATLLHKELTLELAEQVIGSIIRDEEEEITFERIQNVVCDYFNISREKMLSKSRKRTIVQARQIAMYISRKKMDCSLATIGDEHGGKDHSTVLHACNTVSDLISVDEDFRRYVDDILQILSPVN